MTIRHLKIFVSVCENNNSVTKAAEALYIAQPTVSQSIAELERQYNVELFERINRRLVLTEIGQELLAKAREILASFEDFESLAESRGKTPRVRIGSALTLGQTVIPPFLQALRKSKLQLRPSVTIKPSAAIQKELENGNLDFAILDGEIESPYLTSRPFRDEKLVVVAHHSFAVPARLRLKEFVKYPLLLREHGNLARDYLDRLLHEHNLSVQPTIDSVNNQALITATFAGLGIALLPDSVVRGHIRQGSFKEIAVEGLDAIRTISIVMHKNKKLNPIQQEAFELLQSINETLTVEGA